MAKKRKKNKSGDGSLAFLAIFLFAGIFAYIVFYLTILTSFILILIWLYFEYMSWKFSEIKIKELSSFKLTEAENESIAELTECLSDLDDELIDFEKEKCILENNKIDLFNSGEMKNIKKRNDGLFDTRNSKGQQLNNSINEVKNDIKILENDIELKNNEIEKIKYDIRCKKGVESQRIEDYTKYILKWISINSFKSSFRYTLVFYTLLVTIITIIRPSFILGLSNWLNNHSSLPILNSFEFIYGAMLLSCLISCFILWQLNVYTTKKMTNRLIPSWAILPFRFDDWGKK